MKLFAFLLQVLCFIGGIILILSGVADEGDTMTFWEFLYSFVGCKCLGLALWVACYKLNKYTKFVP